MECKKGLFKKSNWKGISAAVVYLINSRINFTFVSVKQLTLFQVRGCYRFVSSLRADFCFPFSRSFHIHQISSSPLKNYKGNESLIFHVTFLKTSLNFYFMTGYSLLNFYAMNCYSCCYPFYLSRFLFQILHIDFYKIVLRMHFYYKI